MWTPNLHLYFCFQASINFITSQDESKSVSTSAMRPRCSVPVHSPAHRACLFLLCVLTSIPASLTVSSYSVFSSPPLYLNFVQMHSVLNIVKLKTWCKWFYSCLPMQLSLMCFLLAYSIPASTLFSIRCFVHFHTASNSNDI